MAATNTPLDSLKNAVLRATESIGCAVDHIAGGACDHDHEDAFEWFDGISKGLWLALIEHVPGARWNDQSGRPEFTPEGRHALRTYDDGTPVKVTIEHESGHYSTDWFPRFDGPYQPFLERFENWAVIHAAESIAYEAANPAPADGDEGANA